MADNSLDPKKYQQVVELLKQIRRGYETLGEANPFTGQTAREFIDAMGDADNAIIKLVDGVDELDKSLDNVGKNAKGYYETLIGLNGAIKKQNENLNITKRATSQIQGIAEKLKDDQEGINRLNAKELKQLQQKYKSQLSNFQIANKEILLGNDGERLNEANLKKRLASLLVAEKITEGHADMIMEIQAESSVLTDINQKLADREAKEAKVAEYNELTNKALDSAGGLMKSIGFGKYADMFKDIGKEANELTEELYDQQQSSKDFNRELLEAQKNGERTTESLQDVMGDADIEAKVLGDTLVKGATKFKKEMLAALDVAIFKGFKDGIKAFGAAREDLAKTFGLGRSDANALKDQMNFMANSASEADSNLGHLRFNIADAVKGIQEFNAEIGGAVRLTQDELKTFSLLSNEFGLTNQQAAEFVKSAKLRGESAEDLTATLRGQVAILAEQEGVAVNQQQVFSSIGDMSAATRLSMQGQGKSLANAAFQAAKLGMNQAQLEKTSSSLLDFESSIAAEMEAELMTGKQLNLEDARRAALMGDQEGLAKAISREIGTSAEFGEMNVLQQQSLAKAFGMSREELAETLETQELLTGEAKSMTQATEMYKEAMKDGVVTDKERLAIGSEQLTNQLQAEAASKRFEDAMVKLKDQLTPIIDKFASLLDYLMDGVETVMSFKGVLSGIGKIMLGIAGIRMFSRLSMILKSLGKIPKLLGKIKGLTAGGFGGIFGGAAKSGGGGGGTSTGGGGGGSLTKSSTSAGGSLAGGIKPPTPSGGGGGGLFSSISKKIAEMNPMKGIQKFFKANSGSFVKKMFGKIPILGAALEGIFATSDISSMIAGGVPKEELNKAVGKRAIQALTSIGGAAVGAAAGSFIPIPFVGTLLGGLAGDAVGRWIGGAIADNAPNAAETVGKALVPDDVAEDFISRPGQPIQKFRADDIIMGGTNLTGGGDNNTQAVSGDNNSEVVTLLKELISEVRKGGDVYMDGTKVGKSLLLASSRIG